MQQQGRQQAGAPAATGKKSGGGKKGGGGGAQQPTASPGPAALLRAGSQQGSTVVRVYVQTSLNTRLLVAVPPGATVAAVRGEPLDLPSPVDACARRAAVAPKIRP